MNREATVRYCNRHFPVAEDCIAWHAWVANLLDQYIEIRAGYRTIGTFEL